ncbi:MAG: cobalt-precorrin-5B (C(1))-methyltransferase CbiD [Pseudomonadota bacterium]
MSTLRSGYTTGTCAAAAAKAAVRLLKDEVREEEVEVGLPDGERVHFPVVLADLCGGTGIAAVRKDAGDDPDITHGVLIKAAVSLITGTDIVFEAGEGVGRITKPGLLLPVGEAAINPVPREQIRRAIREITDQGLRVIISIPSGEELAAKTFNPRLGVMGGLSILGTQGRVRPFSCPALQESLKCALSVAWAAGIKAPVFVPGHIGERAARKHFSITAEQVIEVSNEWGFILGCLAEYNLEHLLVLGHPGKLVKLAEDQWDTHSSRSRSALGFVEKAAMEILKGSLPASSTVEGFFMALFDEKRKAFGDLLAGRVNSAVSNRLGKRIETAVVLINLQGDWLGSSGDLRPWR